MRAVRPPNRLPAHPGTGYKGRMGLPPATDRRARRGVLGGCCWHAPSVSRCSCSPCSASALTRPHVAAPQTGPAPPPERPYGPWPSSPTSPGLRSAWPASGVAGGAPSGRWPGSRSASPSFSSSGSGRSVRPRLVPAELAERPRVQHRGPGRAAPAGGVDRVSDVVEAGDRVRVARAHDDRARLERDAHVSR